MHYRESTRRQILMMRALLLIEQITLPEFLKASWNVNLFLGCFCRAHCVSQFVGFTFYYSGSTLPQRVDSCVCPRLLQLLVLLGSICNSWPLYRNTGHEHICGWEGGFLSLGFTIRGWSPSLRPPFAHNYLKAVLWEMCLHSTPKRIIRELCLKCAGGASPKTCRTSCTQRHCALSLYVRCQNCLWNPCGCPKIVLLWNVNI